MWRWREDDSRQAAQAAAARDTAVRERNSAAWRRAARRRASLAEVAFARTREHRRRERRRSIPSSRTACYCAWHPTLHAGRGRPLARRCPPGRPSRCRCPFGQVPMMQSVAARIDHEVLIRMVGTKRISGTRSSTTPVCATADCHRTPITDAAASADLSGRRTPITGAPRAASLTDARRKLYVRFCSAAWLGWSWRSGWPALPAARVILRPCRKLVSAWMNDV